MQHERRLAYGKGCTESQDGKHLVEISSERGEGHCVLCAVLFEFTLELALDQLQDVLEKHQHSRYWYGCRFERLDKFAREELPEDLKKRYFSICANGTADPSEHPTYAQDFNSMRWQVEKREKQFEQMRQTIKKAEDACRDNLKAYHYKNEQALLDALKDCEKWTKVGTPPPPASR